MHSKSTGLHLLRSFCLVILLCELSLFSLNSLQLTNTPVLGVSSNVTADQLMPGSVKMCSGSGVSRFPVFCQFK